MENETTLHLEWKSCLTMPFFLTANLRLNNSPSEPWSTVVANRRYHSKPLPSLNAKRHSGRSQERESIRKTKSSQSRRTVDRLERGFQELSTTAPSRVGTDRGISSSAQERQAL